MSVSKHILSLTLACPLCKCQASFFTKIKNKQTYFRCENCLSVFMHPDHYVCAESEIKRYATHNNDVTDEGYQNFVSPITNAIKSKFLKHHQGLDYGCGTGPVATYVLNQDAYHNIELYDPFFHHNPEVLEKKYDFIICCEVMEHFHKPYDEFKKLRLLLKNKGQLLCKTALFLNKLDKKDFEKWYYKDDETHVFFYGEKSLKYIQEKFGFTDLTFDSKLIKFSL